jgi:hypothetical protein
MDELLRTSCVENEFVMRNLNHWIKTLSQSEVEQIELSSEGQSGVIRLEDLVSGKQQIGNHVSRNWIGELAPNRDGSTVSIR